MSRSRSAAWRPQIRGCPQHRPELRLIHQLGRLFRREPGPAALTSLKPVLVLGRHPQEEHVDGSVHSAIWHALDVLVASKARLFDVAFHSRLLSRLSRCRLRVREAGPWPAFRDHPSPRLARGDEQHLDAATGTAADGQGSDLAGKCDGGAPGDELSVLPSRPQIVGDLGGEVGDDRTGRERQHPGCHDTP